MTDLTYSDEEVIGMYLDHLRSIERADTTIRTYETILRAAHRELPAGLLQAHTVEIAEWIGRLPAAASRVTYRSAIRGCCRWAATAGWITYDPAAAVRRPKVRGGLPHPCSTDQLRAILAGTTGRERLWSLIAAYLGARCCEIARLAREHIEPRTTLLHGKGDKLRHVPTHELVWAAVRHLPPGPIALGRTAHYISDRLRQVYRRLGLEVTAHELRHWYGTELVAAGADIEEVRDLMGHSSLTTTMGYVLVASPRLREAVSRLPAAVT